MEDVDQEGNPVHKKYKDRQAKGGFKHVFFFTKMTLQTKMSLQITPVLSDKNLVRLRTLSCILLGYLVFLMQSTLLIDFLACNYQYKKDICDTVQYSEIL